jgi:hypothetical protein
MDDKHHQLKKDLAMLEAIDRQSWSPGQHAKDIARRAGEAFHGSLAALGATTNRRTLDTGFQHEEDLFRPENIDHVVYSVVRNIEGELSAGISNYLQRLPAKTVYDCTTTMGMDKFVDDLTVILAGAPGGTVALISNDVYNVVRTARKTKFVYEPMQTDQVIAKVGTILNRGIFLDLNAKRNTPAYICYPGWIMAPPRDHLVEYTGLKQFGLVGPACHTFDTNYAPSFHLSRITPLGVEFDSPSDIPFA